jgi:hypothetical protein
VNCLPDQTTGRYFIVRSSESSNFFLPLYRSAQRWFTRHPAQTDNSWVNYSGFWDKCIPVSLITINWGVSWYRERPHATCCAFGMSVHRNLSRLPWQFFRQQLRERVWDVPPRHRIKWTRATRVRDTQCRAPSGSHEFGPEQLHLSVSCRHVRPWPFICPEGLRKTA